ncbi:MAG TPA: hypothetical protein VG298_03520 [Acidimicrobiales bacterium]|nr:hypothetical protein [Acidimicrobiales bacterium]
MSRVVIDYHLLRDVLAAEQGRRLTRLTTTNEVTTTNLYYVRLCKSVVGSRGGTLTGSWAPDRRRELGRRLLELPDSIVILPMRLIGYRMAELAESQRLSTLGAEAVAAAEHLGASLCVWDGDDGPGIREAARSAGVTYRTIPL